MLPVLAKPDADGSGAAYVSTSGKTMSGWCLAGWSRLRRAAFWQRRVALWGCNKQYRLGFGKAVFSVG
jgi:hypothetical protein